MGDHTADYLRGTAAALRGDLDAAIDAFERALERDPTSLPVRLSLLEALARVGRTDDADRIAEQLLELEPPESAAFTAVARLREREGRPGDAAALLARADVVHDLSAYALYLRVLVEEGRFEEALLEAERGLGWELARPYALLTKGVSLLHFGDHAGAVEAFDQLDPRGYDDLLADWADGVRAANRADGALCLLEAASGSETARALAQKLRQAA
jgi:tetratricopeptide (TPR) repeat protein